MTTVSIALAKAWLCACVCACACAAASSAGCAGESRGRPPDPPLGPPPAPAAPPAPPAPPLPDDAFAPDPTAEAPAPAPSRFATRRIGEDGRRETARFHGAPVDVDLKSADLQDVFRLLADVGRVNIVVAGEVSGTVTMRLRRVPWDQALDVVARAKGLALEREGNVILVRVARAESAPGN